MDILFLIVGSLLGAAIVWLLKKNNNGELRFVKDNFINLNAQKEEIENKLAEAHTSENTLTTDLAVANEKIATINKTKEELQKQTQEQINKITDLNHQLTSKTVENENLKKEHNSYKEEVKEMQQTMKVQFENSASKILDEKSDKFTKQNQENITNILSPLKEKLSDFEKTVKEAYDKEGKERFSLKGEIKRLSELNIQISTEAHNLTNALKGETKTQGNWGEMILETILERSGLQKDREYFVQPSYRDEEGKQLRPDIIVSYPGARKVIIDSKVSLIHYEKYCSATIGEEQEQAFKNHIHSLKTHIKQLSDKKYENIPDLKRSLDFVMMFVPIEPAYLLAIQKDPELWNFAYEKRILLISPTNLIAALKMISSLWKQEYQSKNVEEIAKLGGNMYDQFVNFYTDLEDVGKNIDKAKQSYLGAMGKLYDGKGNLISRSQRMKDLGAKAKKSLPDNLIEKVKPNAIIDKKNS